MQQNTVAFHNADFMTFQFTQRFDIVTYWDGFGLGTPDDHVALLRPVT